MLFRLLGSAVRLSLRSHAGPRAALAEKVASENRRATPSGIVSFKPAAGWSLRNTANGVVLEAPEPDTHIVIVETKEADPAAAIATAWKEYRPDFNRSVKVIDDRPGRDGWEAAKVFNYETSPNERLIVQATAYKLGRAWMVVIFDGSEPTVDKRLGPIGVIMGSIIPAGYQRESFAKRKALALTPGRVAARSR